MKVQAYYQNWEFIKQLQTSNFEPENNSMEKKIRILLFEDNKKYQESLKLYFEDSEQIFLTAVYEHAKDALKRIEQHSPDVVLMDIEMPGISGIEALQQIKAKKPQVKILMQTVFDDSHRIFVSLCAGASGYVIKSAGLAAYGQAIVDVHNGGGYFSPSIASKVIALFQSKLLTEQVEYVNLTKSELEILQCMTEDGPSYKMIADRLGKTYDAVHYHVKNIYKKLHVNCMTEAVIIGIKKRLI